MKKFFAATAIASVLAAPAFAGALIFEPAPEPQVAVAPPAPAPAPVLPTWTGGYVGGMAGWGWGEDDALSDNGFNYGGQLGFDFDVGGFVLGAEAAYDRPNLDFGAIEIDQVVRLTARGGVGFGNTLAYVRGGGAWLDGTGDDWGWTAGAGVEHLITNNISAGLEYNYHRVDNFADTDERVQYQQVGARVNFRF